MRRIRFIFDFSDSKMIELFALADEKVTRAQISDWLKKDDNPDFVALAAACGIPGETIAMKDQVAPAFARMLAAEGAYFLHVLISEEENVWPLVPPGVNNGEMLEETA